MEKKPETVPSKEEDTGKKPLPYCCMECRKRFGTYGEYILHLKEEHGI